MTGDAPSRLVREGASSRQPSGDHEGTLRLFIKAPNRMEEGPESGNPDRLRLHRLIIALGCSWCISFLIVGCGFRLQTYGDGSIFSYAVAAREAWAFHWHNISGRLFSYLYASWPSEAYVGWSGDGEGGIALYGLLFYLAPALGLLATFQTDGSHRRSIFLHACLSTVCLCPLVFGAPTELWITHALFWPALALGHRAIAGSRQTRAIVMFLVFAAMVLTHEAGVPLLALILMTISARSDGPRQIGPNLVAGSCALVVWLAVKLVLLPDGYTGAVLDAAAFKLIDPANLTRPILILLYAAVIGYALTVALLGKTTIPHRHTLATALVVGALALHWSLADAWLHAEDRYVVRLAFLLGMAVLGLLSVRNSCGRHWQLISPIDRLTRHPAFAPKHIGCTLLLISLVHAVETGKFVSAWTDYTERLRDLAMGAGSDPELGDPSFVSAERLGPELDRLSWDSTTPFLSVLVAPKFEPARLVVDPSAGYYWLDCQTARDSEMRSTAISARGRLLIRLHACVNEKNRTWTTPAG